MMVLEKWAISVKKKKKKGQAVSSCENSYAQKDGCQSKDDECYLLGMGIPLGPQTRIGCWGTVWTGVEGSKEYF